MPGLIAYVDASRAARSVKLANTVDAAWARFGNRTVIWMPEQAWDAFTRKTRDAELRAAAAAGQALTGQPYLVIQVGAAFQHDYPAAKIILDQGRYLVVDLAPTEVAQLNSHEETCWALRPLPRNSVIVETLSPTTRDAVPWVQALVAQLAQPTYGAWHTTLASYPTRHSLSTHYLNAATWACDQLRRLGYQARLEPITVGGGSSHNVVAEQIVHTAGVRDLVLVTAHLDSINHGQGVDAPAPGADDNASGSAGVLEMARIFAHHPAQADLRLVLFGGEEQGLHGSTQYVANLPASDRARVRGVINMDMIATRNTVIPTVLLEGAPISQPLITLSADAAATYTGLAVQTSLNPFASDHVPFINALMPAVLTIEGADSANTNIHTANDTLAHIDYDLALDILRMNTAAAATLLGRAETISATPRASGPVVAWGPNRLDAFVVGADSALYHRWWDGASWRTSLTP